MRRRMMVLRGIWRSGNFGSSWSRRLSQIPTRLRLLKIWCMKISSTFNKKEREPHRPHLFVWFNRFLMTSITEDALERLRDEDLRALSGTIDKILEGRRKRSREDDEDDEANTRAIEEANKIIEKQESVTASDFVLPFGKHKGSTLQDVDLGYLTWAIGYKRAGMTFTPRPECGIMESHPQAYTRIKSYLTWRCWACRSTAVRFRNAKLCTSCWLSSRN